MNIALGDRPSHWLQRRLPPLPRGPPPLCATRRTARAGAAHIAAFAEQLEGTGASPSASVSRPTTAIGRATLAAEPISRPGPSALRACSIVETTSVAQPISRLGLSTIGHSLICAYEIP